MGGIAGQYQNSQSSSAPLDPLSRAITFQYGNNAIQNAAANMNAPQYTSSGYVDPGAFKALQNGDYEALQESLLKGSTAALDRQKMLDSQNVDSDLAKRGIYSSGLAVRAQGDNNERYAPSYAQAAANAVNQRYAMQQSDLNNYNQYNLATAGARNTWNANDAAQKYQSAWAPLNYLTGLWNGTGGQVSKNSSVGYGGSVSGLDKAAAFFA